MRVFADLHHGGLYQSLQLLFEKRLGWELFRPIGEEWFREGYWKIAEPYSNNPGTITQYLGLRDGTHHPPDGTGPLNVVKERSEGYYLVEGRLLDHKAVTLEQFGNMEFDIILASYLRHYHTLTELRNKYQPRAKVVCQAGNNWLLAANWNEVKNMMAACARVHIPPAVNAIFYHEEFDTGVYRPPDQKPESLISSFVNTLGQPGPFGGDWQTFLTLEKVLAEFEFKSYGASCRDGVVNGDEAIAKLMQKSMFGFHLKSGGDGMGLVIHQWFACGRPPIVRMSQYRGQLAGELMIDGKTCIDLDKGTIEEGAERIRHFSQPEEYDKLCRNAYEQFKGVVDFDEEEKRLRVFLDDLR